MKLLFVGESWLGSCARSLREALARAPGVELEEVAEDALIPKARSLPLRAFSRFALPLYKRELRFEIQEKIQHMRPEVVVCYKGWGIEQDCIRMIKAQGIKVVNVYPDYSPHAYGDDHRTAVGEYDLVISTKPYHPELWKNVYGYNNRCVFVPQGYDPALHLVSSRPESFKYDAVMVATYRPEYGKLLLDFAKGLNGKPVSVAIGGNGWQAIRSQLPSDWVFLGPMRGRSYIRALRAGKICIAPLTPPLSTGGKLQPGDVDTTRTYELPAAHCFFLHQRTDFVEQLFPDGAVPMFDKGADLAAQVLYFQDREDERMRLAEAAHRRAVPAYSIDSRAGEVLGLLRVM